MRQRPFDLSAFAAAAAFAAALAVPDPVAAADAAKGDVTQKQEKTQRIDVTAMTLDELVGQPVLTEKEGVKIGEVAGVIRTDAGRNHLLVTVGEEHRQMGIDPQNPQAMEGKKPPVIVGGATVAMDAGIFRRGADGKSLVVSTSDLITIENWPPESANQPAPSRR